MPIQSIRRRHFVRCHALAALLLAAYWALAVSAAGQKSVAFDELAHLTAGYSYWLTGDFRLHPENGNLPQRWAALPLLVTQPRFPPVSWHRVSVDEPAWHESNVWILGHEFFFELQNDADRMLWFGRAMIGLLGVALGLLVYRWAGRLFGSPGALIALVLYAFSPTMLAHGALVTSDMAAALFFMASAWSLWSLYHRMTPRILAASSLSLAGLALCKMSAVLIIPIALALAMLRLVKCEPLDIDFGKRYSVHRRTVQSLAIGAAALVQTAVVVAAIWLSFNLRFDVFRDRRPTDRLFPGGWEFVLQEPSWATRVVGWARTYRLLPEAYLYGFAMAERFARERQGFLNGQFSMKGWPWFFPYCFLVKTSLPVFALVGFAAVAAISRRRQGPFLPDRFTERAWATAPLWVLLVVYWAAAIGSHLNIGHRHLLPIYPAVFVLAGAAGLCFARERKAIDEMEVDTGKAPHGVRSRVGLITTLVVVVLGLHVAESLHRWPNYLSYFNQLVGGPWYGYRHLVDSSLDWGQDLIGLKRWQLARDRGASFRTAGQTYLSYFGTGSPEYYQIDALRLPGYGDPHPPATAAVLKAGTYCISATMLQGLNLVCTGPWTSAYESNYQELKTFRQEYARVRRDPAAREAFLRRNGRPKLSEIDFLFDQFRFGRLCAFLRRREPDDEVGYSILVYHLTGADLDQALNGPNPALH